MFLCNETITLIRHTIGENGAEYIPVVIHGASWHGYRSLELTDNGVITLHSISVRIPADALPANIIPHSGDYVFRGELIGNVTPAEFLCDENCVLVRSVHDNRRTVDNIPQCFPHWRLTA